jgi:hypothetical protein
MDKPKHRPELTNAPCPAHPARLRCRQPATARAKTLRDVGLIPPPADTRWHAIFDDWAARSGLSSRTAEGFTEH